MTVDDELEVSNRHCEYISSTATAGTHPKTKRICHTQTFRAKLQFIAHCQVSSKHALCIATHNSRFAANKRNQINSVQRKPTVTHQNVCKYSSIQFCIRFSIDF